MTTTIPNSFPSLSYEPFELDHDDVDDDHDDDELLFPLCCRTTCSYHI